MFAVFEPGVASASRFFIDKETIEKRLRHWRELSSKVEGTDNACLWECKIEQYQKALDAVNAALEAKADPSLQTDPQPGPLGP